MKVNIGKSRIEVSVEGCFRCGTLWSSRWFALKDVPMQIACRVDTVTLHVCADCASPAEKITDQTILAEVGYVLQ